MQKKKGISLIVLVITIIVMVILAAAIILTLNNSGIIGKASTATVKMNMAEVQDLASLKWSEAYLEMKKDKTPITQAALEAAVLQKLGEENIDLTPYDIVVTEKGVDVEAVNPWVSGEVDGVPIPKGFVASSAIGENTKNGGLVIYEGTDPVTDENVEDAKRSRNQYVWVPVDDFSKFVRQDFGNTSIELSNKLGTDYWEVVLDATNMPLPAQGSGYMTITTPEGGITNTLEEVQAMYASVKEYKGFYIARYETGIDTQRREKGNVEDLPGIKEGTTVYSVMGKIPYNYIPWTWKANSREDTNGAVEVSRRMYPLSDSNYGAVSTLTYGVQWDRTLAWWLEVGAKDGKGNVVTSVTGSTSYGNYYDNKIKYVDLNKGAQYSVFGKGLEPYQTATTSSAKTGDTVWALTTGALKAASINNIYDMAGNMEEWTMEGYIDDYAEYVVRGGDFYAWGDGYGFTKRDYKSTYGADDTVGFRTSLYIKK